MDLTFQGPILLFTAWDFISNTSHMHNWVLFLFGSNSSFFLELFLCWSPVAYRAPTDLESSSFSVLSFCLFILLMGFSRQEYWSDLPFLSPLDHILSEFSTMTHLSWVALYGMSHSFIELDKAVVHGIRLAFCDCSFQSVCTLMEKYKRLMEASWWELPNGSFLMGETDWGGNWVLFWWAGPWSVNL